MSNASLLATLVAEKELEIECQARVRRVVRPTVVEPEGLGEIGSRLFPEGTVTCFVADVSSGQAELIQRAIADGREAIDRFASGLQAMETNALAGAAVSSTADMHLVDVRYGGTILGRALAPSLVPVAVSRAVWNGGDLDPGKFEAADYVREVGSPAVEVLVVLSRPTLTELEEATVRAVPSELDEIHVKGPTLSWTPAARAGILRRFDQGARGRAGLEPDPLGHMVQEHNHQMQVQDQQADTQMQQQQQQQQQADHQHMDQHQLQQDRAHTQQQQEHQVQDVAHTEQQQQQQQQDRDNHQVQEQYQQDRQTHQGHQQHQGLLRWQLQRPDDREGILPEAFDHDQYVVLLESNDFSSLDATQSARALIGLREQLLRYGLP